jgi:hypothetical protein
VQLGTPAQDFLILMDSGSGDFWVPSSYVICHNLPSNSAALACAFSRTDTTQELHCSRVREPPDPRHGVQQHFP